VKLYKTLLIGFTQNNNKQLIKNILYLNALEETINLQLNHTKTSQFHKETFQICAINNGIAWLTLASRLDENPASVTICELVNCYLIHHKILATILIKKKIILT
jgi:hypothetical protein